MTRYLCFNQKTIEIDFYGESRCNLAAKLINILRFSWATIAHKLEPNLASCVMPEVHALPLGYQTSS
jgi:hypothetical protein